MNLEQIKKALEKGLKVYWENDGYEVLKDKLGRKPGDSNHLVNIMKNGSMKFFLIQFSVIDSDDNILEKMGSSQSAMGLNFTKTFG